MPALAAEVAKLCADCLDSERRDQRKQAPGLGKGNLGVADMAEMLARNGPVLNKPD